MTSDPDHEPAVERPESQDSTGVTPGSQCVENDFQNLPPGASRVWRIVALIRSCVIMLVTIAILAIIVAAGGFEAGLSKPLAGIVALLPTSASFLQALFWPSLKWRSTQWRLTADSVELNTGVIWRREMTVPRSRIQHTEVTEGPLQRKHDLGSLTVYTAGERYADVTISGLNIKEARDLRDQLLNRAPGHVV